MSRELILPSSFGLGAPLLFMLVIFLLGLLLTYAVFRDARRRGASDGIAALAAAASFLTAPLGFLVYLVLAITGLADSIIENLQGAAKQPVGGPQQPPAGWYDDPEGAGQRWWDGSAWTEHPQGSD